MEILNTPLSRLKQPEFFPECWKSLLSGVVAFVDVRTGSDNRSKSIASEVEKLGATVVTNFSKKVTHVIFKDGSKPIYDKAKASGIPIVSYLWVVACKDKGEMVPTQDHAAINSQDYDSPFFKWRKVKSMQPKDLEEEMKIVERRLDRKRKKMRESLLLTEPKIDEPSLPYTPITEKKAFIDILIESSPLVQERIQQELASGKTCDDVFTLNEKEEDDFDTFFDTPLMIKFISKNYYSPRDPPPSSIRKILSGIKTDSVSSAETPSSSAIKTEPSKIRVTPTQESVRLSLSNSPLSQSNIVKTNTKRKTRSSMASVPKRWKENQEDVEETVPRRKRLFQSKHIAQLPQDPLVAMTPEESPSKIKKAHPCFSQATNHLRSDCVNRQTNAQPTSTTESTKTPPRRDSLADFKLTSISRKRSDKKQSSATIVCTSLHSEVITVVEEAVKKLHGFKLNDAVDDSTTHIVCGDSRRTLNVMRGVIRGAKVVTIDWVTDSISSGKWLDEDKYPVPRFSTAAALYFKNKKSLFEGKGPIYVSPKSLIPSRDLIDLIKCGGGELTIVSKKASLIVGLWKPQANVPCVKGTWILDSIEKGIALSLTDYLITS